MVASRWANDVAGGVGLGVLEVFPGVRDALLEAGAVELRDEHRLLGHNGAAVARYLGKSAVHKNAPEFGAFLVHFENARAQR